MLKLIGLYGEANCGKSEVAKIIQHELPSFKIIAFGDIIKQISNILYHTTNKQWEDRQFKTKYRYLLDDLGKALRSGLHGKVIIEALMVGLDGNNIISDVRRQEEIDAIGINGGKLIYVNSDNSERDGTIENVTYSQFDHVICNNGTLEDLDKKVVEILVKLGLK